MKRWTIAAQKCNTSLKVALVDESLSWELLTSYCTIMLSRRKGWPLKGWNVLRANWPKFAVQVTFLDPCIDFKWGSFFVNGGWDVCYIQLLISTLCVSGCNCAALCRRPPAKNAKRCLSNVTVRCSLACVLRKHLLWQEEWRVGYNKIHGKAVMTVTYTLTCKHRKQCSGVHTCIYIYIYMYTHTHTHTHISYRDMATTFYSPVDAHPSAENWSIPLSALSEEMWAVI